MPTEFVASLLDAVPVPLLLVGAGQQVIRFNHAAIAMFGAIREGQAFVTVVRHPDVLAALDAALVDGRAGEAAFRIPGQSRETTYIARCAPVPGGSGPQALISFEDRSDVEQVGAIRRDFVANVSHELRTPLTALLGFIETLRGAARHDPAARDRFLEIMQSEAERMNRLVSDLMSLTQVEAEERVRPTGPVDPVALVRSSIAALRPLAEIARARVLLEADLPPVAVQADPDQLTQVFSNLLENALKYGAQGGEVRVVVRRIDRDAQLRGPALRVEVRDNGEGIDPLHLPRLTERFYRVDTHRSREKGGTGLGLAIVKHIVIRHRGRLVIDSQKGVGSTFSVVLPLA